jgi:hypothetical protein
METVLLVAVLVPIFVVMCFAARVSRPDLYQRTRTRDSIILGVLMGLPLTTGIAWWALPQLHIKLGLLSICISGFYVSTAEVIAVIRFDHCYNPEKPTSMTMVARRIGESLIFPLWILPYLYAAAAEFNRRYAEERKRNEEELVS